MSEHQQPVMNAPMTDPVAVEPPTTTAPEANIDPIRPTGTDALTAESRPELNAPADTIESVPAAGAEHKTEKARASAVKVEAQPINEGLLGYKAPGLVK